MKIRPIAWGIRSLCDADPGAVRRESRRCPARLSVGECRPPGAAVAGFACLDSSDLLPGRPVACLRLLPRITAVRPRRQCRWAVNLSDIAAMGGTPRFPLCRLGLSADTEVARLDAFVDGGAGRSRSARGYPGRGRHLPQSRAVDHCRDDRRQRSRWPAIGRGGARIGDLVLVSGTLGDSALALALWQQGAVPPPSLAARHNRPPRGSPSVAPWRRTGCQRR